MSGIEIAGLVFGVVPIVVEILKSYRATKERLSTFRRYAQVLHDVQLRYLVAATSFTNECQLLLRAIVENKRELAGMFDDAQHDAWLDPALETRLRAFLERDCTLFEGIVTKIRDVLRDTQAALGRLSEGHHTHTTTTQRLYLAFNTSRNENQYRQWLDELDIWNSKLSKLRKQRCKLQKRQLVQGDCLVRKAVPRQYSDIRAASQRLHESLQDAWSCTNISHTGHQAKLSIEAKAEEGNVRLDMVIACRRNVVKPANTTQLQPDPPIWLHIQTIRPGPYLAVPVASITNTLKRSTQHPQLDEYTAKSKPTKRKSKSVSFVTSGSASKRRSPEPTSDAKKSQPESYATLDLKATQSICDHLSQACASSSTCPDPCLGYLEHCSSALSSRLIFYDASKNAVMGKHQSKKDREAIRVISLLQNLRTIHQLTLAHQLAVAILQYHSTSWIAPDWSLKDVSYFKEFTSSSTESIEEHLQSLHLDAQFPLTEISGTTQVIQNHQDLKFVYGIRNLPLAKLGIALLEIGCQTEIGKLTATPAAHDVINARKVLLSPPAAMSHLGGRYLKIARKCLECDFACGDDLSEVDLQGAFYTEVVCGLDGMLQDLRKFLGLKKNT
ncbi:hypothetical protein E8E13_010074 [Curvularia kusanoi]|uniref:Uncharacterized protein n=1 Tax=Curvularia kusanoi TaxID=90978 RepID=A0A9P4TFD9_CURKU|nr:hypothetical protein E8E13_010074 [Curvularia kusanoi]